MAFRIATMPTFEVAGRTAGGGYIRENDGALIVLSGAADDDLSRRALIIPRVVRLKRSEAYDTPDPEQEAFAARVVGLLNAFEGIGHEDVEALADGLTFAYEDDTAPIFDLADGEARVKRIEALADALKAIFPKEPQS